MKQTAKIVRGWGLIGLGLALAVCLGGSAIAQEAELLSSESGGQLTVDGPARLRVSGFQGGLVLRGGRSGELRYEARRFDDRRTEQPIGLWRTGSTLALRPLEESSDVKVLLEVAVPVELNLDLDLHDCRVEIGGLHTAIDLRGEGIDGDLRGINGVATVDVNRSRLRLDGVAGGVYFEGDDVELILQRLGREAELRLANSTVELSEVSGPVDLDLESTHLAAKVLQSPVELRAIGGSVRIDGATRGLRAQMEEATLELSDVSGRVEIESDSDVDFQALKAQLTINNFGGGVSGRGNSGPTFISTARATVSLANMDGTVVVRGDGLDVRVGDSGGAITIHTTSSEIALDKPAGRVSVENDFGGVRIEEPADKVDIVNRQGDVQINRAHNTVNVRADGGSVSVSWAELPPEDQTIETDGEMNAHFPIRSACRVEAESTYGRIESDVDSLRVADDERFASGVLSGANQPVVQLKAGGNLYIGYALDQ